MKFAIIYENRKHKNKIVYSFCTLLNIIGINSSPIIILNRQSKNDYSAYDLIISYGKNCLNINNKPYIHIYESGFFGSHYLTDKSLPNTPIDSINGIPILYKSLKNKINFIYNQSQRKIELNADIIASTFFMVSNYEELIKNKVDTYGRLLAKDSFAYKYGYLGRPVVNEYAMLVKKWLKQIYPNFHIKNQWPLQNKFAVALTHDIDSIKKFPRYRSLVNRQLHNFKRGRILRCVRTLNQFLKIKGNKINDPYIAFDKISKAEKQRNQSSSFYFFGRNNWSSKYHISEDNIISMIIKLSHHHEIGLHGLDPAHLESEALTKQLKSLKNLSTSSGIRMHYLNFNINKTPEVFETSSLKYDTTLGYPDYEGFKNGIAYPFPLYDHTNDQPTSITEIPLVIMDTTLYENSYRNLKAIKAQTACISILKKIKEVNGAAAILWHNATFDNVECPGYEGLYLYILDWIKNNYGWGTNAENIVQYASAGFKH